LRFAAGLDLGQSQDFTALSIIEGGKELQVRHLQRWQLNTPYTKIAEDLEAMFARPELADTEVVVDHTGVGRGVVDLLRQCKAPQLRNLIAVTITAGDAVSHEGLNWRVPKRDLVGAVQVPLEQGRLKIAPALQAGALLKRELENFKVKIDPKTAHDSYLAWRDGEHDDLVLAVALAVWYFAPPGSWNEFA
jgi:hypothetical protein